MKTHDGVTITSLDASEMTNEEIKEASHMVFQEMCKDVNNPTTAEIASAITEIFLLFNVQPSGNETLTVSNKKGETVTLPLELKKPSSVIIN